MNMKKAIAALLALCLMLCGALGAVAEDDVAADLLKYFLGITDETQTPADEADRQVDGEANGDEYGGGEDGDVYVFDEEEEEIVVDELIQVSDYAVNESLPADWTNILLLGTDSRGSTKYLRTDTMIVFSVNKQTAEAKLTSVMRDTWVEIPGHGGQKLNAACVYGGPELTMRTINQHFGLNLEYYALVNMKCLVEIVDALGGVRLDISSGEAKAINTLIASDEKADDENREFVTTKVQSGSQVPLNGKQTLYYARIRKSDSDYARTARQRTVLTTIARQLQQQSLFSLAGLVTNMLQYVETNLTFEEIMAIAGVCMKMDLNELTEFRIPADGTYESGIFGDTWCIKPNFEENARLLREFIYGD